jgi:SAM-dependent methyltransferase
MQELIVTAGDQALPEPTEDQRSRPAQGDGVANSARRIGISMRRSYNRRVRDGFMARYLSGHHILDIGYRGGDPGAVPVTDTAIGIDLDYPGYDGTHLPFGDGSQDAVLAAHVLEHIPNYQEVLLEWYRVLRTGGFLVVIVPHRYLYERRPDLPSRWNADHKRFYTPASLLAEIEESLPTNGYRIRHMLDNDAGFNYIDPPWMPPKGSYEIELVLERILRPTWADEVDYGPVVQGLISHIDRSLYAAIAAEIQDPGRGVLVLSHLFPTLRYFTPWQRVRGHFVIDGAAELHGKTVPEGSLRKAVAPLLAKCEVDEAFYRSAYPDLDSGVTRGVIKNLTEHWRAHGYFEGRLRRSDAEALGSDANGAQHLNR